MIDIRKAYLKKREWISEKARYEIIIIIKNRARFFEVSL